MTLHLGDCIEVLRTLADNSIDSIVTDPPFGIGFKYEGKKEQHCSAESYYEWFSPVLKEMRRIAKPGAFFAIWQTQLNFKHFWNVFGSDIHIYCAAKNFVQLRKTPINYGYDPVVMWYEAGEKRLCPDKPKRNIDFFVANTAAIVSKPNRIERAHPCPRPLDQVSQILENFVIPGGIVLDPFMGSGTTGLAAKNLGFEFIGIELNAEYMEIAKARVGN